MPAPANAQQVVQQHIPLQPVPRPSAQHLQRPKDGQSHRSSSSRSVNPATGMPDRVGSYAIREEIGRGSFATVYRGEKVTSNPATPVAIKAVIRSKLTTKLLENLESEIRLLKGIKQRNVVELLDCLKTEAHIYLVMAYCSAGDLSQYIRRRGQVPSLTASMQQAYRERYPHPRDGGLNELVVRCFLGQLAEALKFLRKQNIIHRDIKPQNLLLHPPDASDIAAGHPPGIPLLRVADFGFARALPNASLAETLCGSPLYMAPEILRYEKYDAKADLWSVGAVAYEMSVGKPPFRAQNHVELLRRIERGEDRIKFPDEKSPSASADGVLESPPTRVPDDIKALIRGLLKRNPVERMSFTDFFEKADAVGRWGEGSLVAPGTIDGDRAGEAIALRTSAAAATTEHDLTRRDSSRTPSGKGTPASRDAGSGNGASPAEVQHDNVPAAIIPSTGVEQEMAFVRLPQNAYPIQSGNPTVPSSPSEAIANPSVRAGTPDVENTPAVAIRPSTTPRRSTFKPKYVVGPADTATTPSEPSPAEQYGNPVLKTRDYAVITTTAATPTTALPATISRGHSRRSSQDSLRVQPADVLQIQPQLKSNLSLAIPPPHQAQPLQQRDMQASGLTGDDDSVLGREYVVVEKRNVEINALADEMASLPRRQNSISRRNSRGILSRNPTGYGQSPSSPAPIANTISAQAAYSPSPPSPALPYPPTSAQSTAYDHPPFAAPAAGRPVTYSYGSSPRVRTSTLYGSPGRQSATGTYGQQDVSSTAPLSIVGGITTTAIGKALNMASLKLFGSPSENIWLRRHTHRFPFSRRRSRSVTPQDDRLTSEEDELLQKLDDIAQKATVIFDFADSKLILMQPQSSQQSLASQQPSPSRTENTTPAPAQLALGSSQANPFFVNAAPPTTRASPSLDKQPTSPHTNAGQPINSATASGTQSLASSSRPDLLCGETLVLYLKALAFLSKGIEQAREFWSTRPAGQATSQDLNDYVQWMRSRFNECFDKAEYAKGRLVGDIPDSAMLAEKLIFDRALEMSRAAAVSELMGDNTQECEIAYDTALWMLYAILDETMQEGEHVEEEDKATVRNFIESIKGRLTALRRKIRGTAAT